MKLKFTKKRANRYLLLCAILVFLLLSILSNFMFEELSMIIILVSCVVLVYKSKKEIGSSIVFLFLFFSMIQISPEYLFNVKTTAYVYYYNDVLYGTVITILMVFTSIIAIFYNERKVSVLRDNISNKNSYVFLVLLVICAYILIFGINRTISSGYSVKIKTIYEYFIMALCLAYYYSNKTRLSNLILMLFSFVYIVQDFYYGGRISSIQVIILCAILFFPKIKFKRVLQMIFPAYLLLKVVEIYRVNYSLSDVKLSSILRQLFSNPLDSYKWNTFSEVLYSSSGLVYAKESVFSITERLNSFLDFCVNIFVGGVRPFGNIVPYISRNISQVGGGGFFPTYVFFWLGWLGVILISLLIVYLFNFEPKEDGSSLKSIMYVMTLSMFPRWFYYTPLILFRYVILNLIIFYLSLRFLDIASKKFRV